MSLDVASKLLLQYDETNENGENKQAAISDQYLSFDPEGSEYFVCPKGTMEQREPEMNHIAAIAGEQFQEVELTINGAQGIGSRNDEVN